MISCVFDMYLFEPLVLAIYVFDMEIYLMAITSCMVTHIMHIYLDFFMLIIEERVI